jgi:putative membrane protein
LKKFFAALAVAVFVWSAFNPNDRVTWWMEVAPSMIGFGLVAYYWRSFPLSNWLFGWIAIHSCILCIGGKYTYAEVPFGFWAQEVFGFTRNHYDRVGHFAQGFVPAFLAREIILRNGVVPDNSWLKFFVVAICLAFSGFYELIEFGAAVLLNSGADAFLGTQGDQWDTQKDMLLALIGACVALLFARVHDRSMAAMS